MESKTGQNYQVELRELQANGMTFRCRVCGLENQGEPVVLLHGFPETSHTWAGIMRSLAARGYRCLAPDQRGYSPGARPKDIASYRIDKIASDVIALADAVGFGKFHLVGHDWGAGCGWTVVQLYSDRVNSWVALSIPHMAAFDYAKKHDKDQKRRSWYMKFFQTPVIPEVLFGLVAKNRRFWKYSSEPEIEDFVTVFGTRSGRKATINWYRANYTPPISYGDVLTPSVLIWGKQDSAIGKAGVDLTKPYMKGEYRLFDLDAGHALVQEAGDRVEQIILEHIQSYPIKN